MSDDKWLKNKNWDLRFIILSIAFVPVPYLVWIVMGSNTFGRQAINFGIAVLIGGPHMVATFSRTTFDADFRSKYPKFIASSFLIPVIVISLALTNMALLLTVFFTIAALHVIHQASYIVESYNRRERDPDYIEKVIANTQAYSWKESLTNPYYLIDFLVIASALFPIANMRMVQGEFVIGDISLNAAIPDFLEQMWTVYLAAAVFGISAAAFLIKSALEYRSKTLNIPKFLFIFATATALFIGPMMGNLDTSFQGINAWHSFQYLALTYFAIQLRSNARTQEGDHPQKEKETLLERILGSGDLKKFYAFNMGLTAALGVIILIIYGILTMVGNANPTGIYADGAYAFEVAYYIGVLSILWQHYYHDHFLFTQTDALVP